MDLLSDIKNEILDNNIDIKDKALLMCIERIQKLEDNLEEIKKDHLIKIICCFSDKTKIFFDIIFYFLKIPSDIVKENDIKNTIINFLPLYKYNMNQRLEYLLTFVPISINLWNLKEEDFIYGSYKDNNVGSNTYNMLKAMTIYEIEEYINYRLSWSKWKINQKSLINI